MSASHEDLIQPILNFPVNVQSLSPKGLFLKLETDDKEHAALAERHGLLAVKAFSAEIHVRPWKKRGVRASGDIQANITQQCIISSDPIDNVINKHFEAFFVPDDSRLAKEPVSAAEELFLDPDGPDAPEVFHGNIINIGAVAEEFFELAIDPYPRKEGVSLGDIWSEADAGKEALAPHANEGGGSGPISPFAVLAKFKKQE